MIFPNFSQTFLQNSESFFCYDSINLVEKDEKTPKSKSFLK